MLSKSEGAQNGLPAQSRGQWSENVYSVFLVEDNADDQFFGRRLLESSPSVNEVRCFSSGPELITYIKQHREELVAMPVVIIVDLNMPKMDGYELLARIKSNPYLETIPVVIVTGVLSYEAFRKVMELKADAVFRKPMSLEKLETFFRQARLASPPSHASDAGPEIQ